MNKSKINDFINIWAEAVGLTGEENKKYRNFIKNDIAKRCMMYEKEIPSISTLEDSCDAYIIKPVNGEYSIEDFLLNRLMLGLRKVCFTGALKGNSGEYEALSKSLYVETDAIIQQAKETARRHSGLHGKSAKIVQKTIEHELGHCYKSLFSNGFKAPLGYGREQDEIYKKLIIALKQFENGKYASQIKSINEFNLEEESNVEKTGVRDYGDDYRVQWIDELLNETEALELSNSNEVHETLALRDENGKSSSSGNYVNVYNYLSGYRTFTGYGSILKSLLGKEDTFKAEYISSSKIFQQFDREYADIVQAVWGVNPTKFSPIKCIAIDFDDLLNRKHFDENIMLKLDEFFAKCYERKIENLIVQNNGSLSSEQMELTLREIEIFQERLTTNDDPKKRNALAHNVIFNNIIERINELSRQSSHPDFTRKVARQQVIQQPQKEDSSKMKFVKGFIQAYNDTEDEIQYKKRANDGAMDIKRIKEIIESNGMNRTLMVDLEGRWLGNPNDRDFKILYSQKQVSAMARLLKAAQLLTESQKFNPEGRNYLEEFVNIPDIDGKLKQMKDDFRDENSYMFSLKQRAKASRENGTIQSYPPTQTELEAQDSHVGEINHGNAEQSKKISISEVKTSISKGKATTQEAQDVIQEMKKMREIRRLMRRQKYGEKLTPEQQLLIDEHIRQTQQAQIQFRQRQNKVKEKGHGMSM